MENPTDRQERLRWWCQQALTDAHIAVIGAGALGNEVLKNLALMGVGHLHIVDFDLVETSNLSRTVLFDSGSLGQPKASIAAAKIKQLNVNKNATVNALNVDVVWDLGGGYLRRMDLVLGCLDNLEARLSVGAACFRLGVPYIDGGIRELSGRVQLHHPDRGACMDCTIGAGERETLGRRYSCFKVFRSYTSQDVVPTVQVSSAFIAALMCQETVKYLQGRPVPFGSVISWFGETNDFDVLRLIKRGDCHTCGFPPPRPILELPFGAGDAARLLVEGVGSEWLIQLPSPYLTSAHCLSCGSDVLIDKPSHKCKDIDLFCPLCEESVALHFSVADHIGGDSDPALMSKTLRDLGVPAFSVLTASNGNDVKLVELTKDNMFINTTS